MLVPRIHDCGMTGLPTFPSCWGDGVVAEVAVAIPVAPASRAIWQDFPWRIPLLRLPRSFGTGYIRIESEIVIGKHIPLSKRVVRS